MATKNWVNRMGMQSGLLTARAHLPICALQALRNLIVDCVDERMMVPAAASGGKAQGAAPLASVVAAVQSSLSARFQDAWPLALPVRDLG